MKKCAILTLCVFLLSIEYATAQNSYDLWVGETEYLYTPTPPSGTALNKTAWGCDEANISVSRMGDNIKIKVTGYFSGRAKVWCDYYYYGYIYGKMYTGNSTEYYFITCKQVKISLDKENVTLDVGETLQLNESFSPSYVTPKPSVSWSSSDSHVAIVGSGGFVTAKATGSTIITARTSHGTSATCKVIVCPKDIPATQISLPNENEMTVGSSITLKAVLLPIDATSQITWESSDENKAVVSQNGIVKALKTGNVTIRAKTDNGCTAFCKVKIVARSQDEVDKENKSKIYSTKKQVDIFINNIINSFEIW